jgi:phosphohistidine phosphatase
LFYYGRVLTLLLMRHAKSDWDESVKEDRDRPLTKRGWQEARQMAQQLREHNAEPKLILGSNALRVRETVGAVIDELVYRGDIYFHTDLYESSPSVQLRKLRALAGAPSPVLLAGHNPESEEFVQTVCGVKIEMKTANIAVIEFAQAAWADLGTDARGKLSAVWTPSE